MRESCDALASPTAAPAGGSAAAWTGAMAAALMSMACQVSLTGQEAGTAYDALKQTVAEAEMLRSRLAILADEDCDAYRQFVAACQLPRSTEEEAIARRAAICETSHQATTVPLEIARACATVVDRAWRILPHIKRSVLADLGAAALLAEGGLRSAALIVTANLVRHEDSDFVRRTRADLENWQREARHRREQVVAHRT